MNPFDLRGPDFLLFYLLLGAGALVAARLLRHHSTAGEPELLTDPYELAYLRGGPAECVRVALLSLLDRRILKAIHGRIEPLRGKKTGQPLDRALVTAFARKAYVSKAFRDPGVEAALVQTRAALQARGLVPGAEGRARSGRPRVWLVLMLLGVAATKLVVAIARGHTNVLFLVILAVVLPLLVWLAGSPPSITRQGKATLELTRRQFRHLRKEAGSFVPGRSTPELTLYVGLFGMKGLSPLTLALTEDARLRRRYGSAGGSSGGRSGRGRSGHGSKSGSGGSSRWSSSGSSHGSSSGSSGGSSSGSSSGSSHGSSGGSSRWSGCGSSSGSGCGSGCGSSGGSSCESSSGSSCESSSGSSCESSSGSSCGSGCGGCGD